MKKVLILGNGSSRLRLKKFISEWNDEIWVCNKGYTEATDNELISRVYSVHSEVVQDAKSFRKNRDLTYAIVGPGEVSFKELKGWSSGSQALLDALIENYEITALGFDFGGPDVYQSHSVEGSNFKKQAEELKKRFGSKYDAIVFKYPESNNETILLTLMDDNFMAGLRGTMKSLLAKNPDFDYPFYILDNGISEVSKKEILEIYQNTTFKPIRKEDYRLDPKSTKASLLATYFKLEMFRRSLYPKETRRVIFLDMDLLIRKDLTELFTYDLKGKPLGACQQYNTIEDSLSEDINSGVLVLDLKTLPKKAYDDMVKMSEVGSFLPDQGIINDYFLHDRDLCIYLPKTYNVEKRMIASKSMKKIYDDCAILHYVNTKPWEEKSKTETLFEPAYSLWHDLFDPIPKKDYFIHLENGKDLYSNADIKSYVDLALMKKGIITVPKLSYQQDDACGKLIKLLNKMPTRGKDGTLWFDFDFDKKKIHLYTEPSSEKAFQLYLRNKSVIIVGPSPILLGSNNGTFIDAFDVVVRTNNMLNVLLENPGLAKDYGSRTDILYVNVTYERDMKNIWKLDEWKKQGLKFISKRMANIRGVEFPIPWRVTPPSLNYLDPPSPLIGLVAINDLLLSSASSVYVTGIDGYVAADKLEDGKRLEYVDGYLPELEIARRESRIGQPRSLHDSNRDTKLILQWEKESKLNIDPVCREQMEKAVHDEH